MTVVGEDDPAAHAPSGRIGPDKLAEKSIGAGCRGRVAIGGPALRVSGFVDPEHVDKDLPLLPLERHLRPLREAPAPRLLERIGITAIEGRLRPTKTKRVDDRGV